MKPRRKTGTQKRSLVKRAGILETAMKHFAERGYDGARVEDMALEMGISKGSIFQHFKTKPGLFLACYQKGIAAIPDYLDVPAEVKSKGFFEVLRFWLENAETQHEENPINNRVVLLGDFGVSMELRREITRHNASHDPYAIREFVRWGIERGDLRTDTDPEFLAWFLHWQWESFLAALLVQGLDPGLFTGSNGRPIPVEERIRQFVELLRAGVGRR